MKEWNKDWDKELLQEFLREPKVFPHQSPENIGETFSAL